jgi:hypothetical protein
MDVRESRVAHVQAVNAHRAEYSRRRTPPRRSVRGGDPLHYEAIGKPGGRNDPHDWAMLALADQRKGDAEVARLSLDKLRARTPSDGPAQLWEEVEIRLILREAEAMILDAVFPTDPCAP